jgi:hypothetical protein
MPEGRVVNAAHPPCLCDFVFVHSVHGGRLITPSLPSLCDFVLVHSVHGGRLITLSSPWQSCDDGHELELVHGFPAVAVAGEYRHKWHKAHAPKFLGFGVAYRFCRFFCTNVIQLTCVWEVVHIRTYNIQVLFMISMKFSGCLLSTLNNIETIKLQDISGFNSDKYAGDCLLGCCFV